MSLDSISLFPGLLADSAAKLAKDAAGRYPERCSAAVIRDMGWNAVLIAEEHGGVGGEFADLASIMEALAVHAVDLPVLTRCGIVPAMLDALPGNDRVRALLAGIAEGTLVIELGGALDSGTPGKSIVARKREGDWLLYGTTAAMDLTEDCTHVLLTCRSAKNDSLMLINVDAGVLQNHATRFDTMDDRRVAVCTLDGLVVAADCIVDVGPAAEQAVQAGWQVGVLGAATDTVCCMGSALARTVAYLLERQQFGQPLAQFQALRHDTARLYVVYELSRHLLQASLRALNDTRHPGGEGGTAAFDLLGLYTGEEAIRFAESVIQLHGGMGMTREMPAARLATRMLANAFRFGDPLTHYRSLHDVRVARAQSHAGSSQETTQP